MYSFDLIKLNTYMRATNIFIHMYLTEFICVHVGVPHVSLLIFCYYFIMTTWQRNVMENSKNFQTPVYKNKHKYNRISFLPAE